MILIMRNLNRFMTVCCFVFGWGLFTSNDVDAFLSSSSPLLLRTTRISFSNNNNKNYHHVHRRRHFHNNLLHRLDVSLYTPTDKFIIEEFNRDDDDDEDDKHQLQHLLHNKNNTQFIHVDSIVEELDKEGRHAESNRGGRRRSKYNNNNNNRYGRKSSSSSSLPFQQYLKRMKKGFKSKFVLAKCMDEELKRMEMNVYDLTSDDDQCYESLKAEELRYNGPRDNVQQLDPRCYVAVCNAYANSGYRNDQAATHAEEVAFRYERVTGEPMNTHIMTAVMKGWIQADNWEKADSWFERMQSKYQVTGDPRDLPDTITYTSYISGLATTSTLSKEVAANKALEKLQHMRDSFVSGENPYSMPNRFTYAAVMKCQELSCTGYNCLDRVEKVYRQMEEDYKNPYFTNNKPNALKPTAAIGLGLFRAAGHCRGGIEAANKAEQLLQEFKLRYEETGDIDYKPLQGMYTGLLTSFGKVEQASAGICAKKVDKILEDMISIGIEQNEYTITAAITAKVNHRSEESIRQAEELMRRMDAADSVAYQCLIKAYNRIGNAAKADELMNELEDLSRSNSTNDDSDYDSSVSDVMTMGSTIVAWSKAGRENVDTAIERCEELLQRIVTKYRDGQVAPHEKHVDSWVFESVIRLWSSSRKPGAAKRIESLIDDMESLNEIVPSLFNHPKANIFILALDAWAKEDHPSAGRRALALLRKAEKLHADGKMVEPNIRMLSSTLVSLTHSKGHGISKMAEGLYNRILERYKMGDRSGTVNARTQTSLLSMILNIPGNDSSQRALRILQKTIDLGKDSKDGIAPNTIAFNCCLNGLAKRRDSYRAWNLFQQMKRLHSEGYHCDPDIATYSCVVRAVAGNKSPITLQRLQDITDEVFERSELGQLKIDISLVNTILNGYSFTSKHDQACANIADALLTNLELMSSLGGSQQIPTPDLISYTAICRAFALQKYPGSARRAEEILIKAKRLANEGKINPLGSEIYSYVVLAHAKMGDTDSLERAESIIDKMESSFMDGTAPNTKPVTRTYNMLLSSCANKGQLEIASRVFDKMKASVAEGNEKCKPDFHSHNWMILTAARSHPVSPQDFRDHFEIALDHFKLLHSDTTTLQPDGQTYEFFLLACYRLLPAGATRNKLVSRALDLAKGRGLVTGQAVREGYKSDPELILDMFPDDTVPSEKSDDDHDRIRRPQVTIPADWCRSSNKGKAKDQKVHLGPPLGGRGQRQNDNDNRLERFPVSDKINYW